MKKKILFGFFVVIFITMNVFFNIHPYESDISLNQMLKLSQANAEWPFDQDECSTYCSSFPISVDECITRYIFDYECEMLLGGGCYYGRVELWVDRCTNESAEIGSLTYLSCGS